VVAAGNRAVPLYRLRSAEIEPRSREDRPFGPIWAKAVRPSDCTHRNDGRLALGNLRGKCAGFGFNVNPIRHADPGKARYLVVGWALGVPGGHRAAGSRSNPVLVRLCGWARGALP